MPKILKILQEFRSQPKRTCFGICFSEDKKDLCRFGGDLCLFVAWQMGTSIDPNGSGIWDPLSSLIEGESKANRRQYEGIWRQYWNFLWIYIIKLRKKYDFIIRKFNFILRLVCHGGFCLFDFQGLPRFWVHFQGFPLYLFKSFFDFQGPWKSLPRC